MADENKYGVWDIQNKSWVKGRQYDSVSKANAASNRLDTGHGGTRYVPKLIPGSMPESPSRSSAADVDEDVVSAKRGGKISASKRADGIAARGKTRGKIY